MDFDSQQAPHYMESRQSSEQAERRVTAVLLPLFRAMGESEDFLKNSLRVKQVDFNIFAVGTDRIVSTFCDEKGVVILNIKALRRAYYFQKAGYLAGYREIPSDTQPVNLYHIQNIDNKGNPLSGAKPIDKFSREYYKAFIDIRFYDDRLGIETYKLPMTNGKYGTVELKELRLLAESGALRIRDLVVFKKTGQTTETDFTAALAILQKNLLNTIGDYRFERVNQGVTREELDSYLKDGLIDKVLHTRAIQRLEQVEKIKRAVGEKHSEIMSETQVKTAELMNANNEKVA